MPFKTNAIAPGRAHLVDAAALWTPPVGRENTRKQDKNKPRPRRVGTGGANQSILYFTTTAADLMTASDSVTPCLAAAPGFT